VSRTTLPAPAAAEAAEALVNDLEEALALLADYRQNGAETAVAEPLPSLLEQCEALCNNFSGPEPIRSIHHFACTGGTLIAKCLAALPNVTLLSEIDPLSRMKPDPRAAFSPTDIIRALRQSARRIDDSIIIASFHAAINSAAAGLARQGLHLVLRDHAHSQFCTRADAASRPTLHEMLRDAGPVLSLVSVRHPLDSFLSLEKMGWRHFSPFTLEEYSQRYMAFLDRHEGLPVIIYENFVADPQAELVRICEHLTLPFHPLALDLISAVQLTGDSGRSGSVIGPRPRREMPEALARQRDGSGYRDLCARLDYEP